MSGWGVSTGSGSDRVCISEDQVDMELPGRYRSQY